MVKFLVSVFFLVYRGPLYYVLISRKGMLALWPLISLLILLFMRLHAHDLIASQRLLPPNTTTFVIKASTCQFGGGYIQFTAPYIQEIHNISKL